MKDTIFAIRRTLEHYANSGYLLIIVTVLAFVAANSPLSEIYFSLWNKSISLQIGGFNLLAHHGKPMSVMQFINDALMAIFFFSVGLEIKREVLVGELSSVKKAILPVIAALGGIIIPIAIFSVVANGADEMRGVAIPMATDIAFSLGILSLFGKRVPIGLKIFLATLAVADDLFGILAIALFYTETVHYEYLLYSFGLLAIMILGMKFYINSKMFYIAIGIVIWFLFLNSGIHPTISGVLIAFCIPAHPLIKTNRYIKDIKDIMTDFPVASEQKRGASYILTHEQMNMLKSVESASDKVISPLQGLEDSLHPLVNYIIIPLFAFANAGIAFSGITIHNFTQGIAPAIISGLFIGKFLGIIIFTAFAVKFKLSSLPAGVSWRTLAGVAALGGIGFTVSLFIASLSYGEAFPNLLTDAKIGIVAGSLLSGIVGYVLLKKFLPEGKIENEELY
ncbi:MAG: Na+/H+ antiporter NhaA [Bacteroidales bacterium]